MDTAERDCRISWCQPKMCQITARRVFHSNNYKRQWWYSQWPLLAKPLWNAGTSSIWPNLKQTLDETAFTISTCFVLPEMNPIVVRVLWAYRSPSFPQCDSIADSHKWGSSITLDQRSRLLAFLESCSDPERIDWLWSENRGDKSHSPSTRQCAGYRSEQAPEWYVRMRTWSTTNYAGWRILSLSRYIIAYDKLIRKRRDISLFQMSNQNYSFIVWFLCR